MEHIFEDIMTMCVRKRISTNSFSDHFLPYVLAKCVAAGFLTTLDQAYLLIVSNMPTGYRTVMVLQDHPVVDDIITMCVRKRLSINRFSDHLLPYILARCVAAGFLTTLDQAYVFIGDAEQKEWTDIGKRALEKAIFQKHNTNVAKNVILFIGDGLGIPTITATRIYKGQLAGKKGEEEFLNFERFPYSALIKTYNVDYQVADSAGTATAMFTGVKTNYGAIGVDSSAVNQSCKLMTEDTKLKNLRQWSDEKGKSVGVVTTTRLTHATPASFYAFSPDRYWESNVDIPEADRDCTDIAKQLIYDANHLKVVLGGGRRKFLSINDTDPESNKSGERTDENLIESWENMMREKGANAKYVWKLDDFNAVNAEETDYLMGMFAYSHMRYDFDRENDIAGEPSISEMTAKAIEILKKDEDGFFLMVEGGRIDHAHHESTPKKALQDSLAFEKAVQVALQMTSEEDTLIAVTADHSHVMSIGGYPGRGNPILGLQDNDLEPALDGMPYTTIQYANSRYAGRVNLTGVKTDDWEFKSHGLFAVRDETHGGDDVAIYAQGPMSHLFHGVQEQNYIAHVLGYASCVGPNQGHCTNKGERISISNIILASSIFLTFASNSKRFL